MKNKKGIGLGEAFGAVLTLILIAVLVIVGIYLFVALQTGIPNQSVSVVNETAWINSSGYTNSTYPSLCNFIAPSSITALNKTDGNTIAPGNYTINWTSGILYNATAKEWNNVSLNFAYGWGGSACQASTTMIVAFGTFPALIGLVGTIIFLGIVIGVLVGSFVLRRRA